MALNDNQFQINLGGIILLNRKNYIVGLLMALVFTTIFSISVMAETRVIEHSMGETEIDGTPKRIVTFYQGANDTAVALGVTPVGIVESWVEKPVYTIILPALN